MDGMTLVSQSLARVLFDTDTTHSLISVSFMSFFGMEPEGLDPPLFLHSATGYVQVAQVCRMCKVSVTGVSLRVDLAILPMTIYDIILGMDFLTKY